MANNVTYQTLGDRWRFKLGSLRAYRDLTPERLAPLARDAFDRGEVGRGQALSRRFLDKASPQNGAPLPRAYAQAALILGNRHFDAGQRRGDNALIGASISYMHKAWEARCVEDPRDIQTLAYALTVQQRLGDATHVLQRTLTPADARRPDGWAHHPNDGVLLAEMGNLALLLGLQCDDPTAFNQARAHARGLYERADRHPPAYQTPAMRAGYYNTLDENVTVLDATYFAHQLENGRWVQPKYGNAPNKLLELRRGEATPVRDAVLAGLQEGAAYHQRTSNQFLIGTMISINNGGLWQQGEPISIVKFRPENREAMRRIANAPRVRLPHRYVPAAPQRRLVYAPQRRLVYAPQRRLVSAPLPRASSGHGSSAQMDRARGAPNWQRPPHMDRGAADVPWHPRAGARLVPPAPRPPPPPPPASGRVHR